MQPVLEENKYKKTYKFRSLGLDLPMGRFLDPSYGIALTTLGTWFIVEEVIVDFYFSRMTNKSIRMIKVWRSATFTTYFKW